jgi:Lon protease-like protein
MPVLATIATISFFFGRDAAASFLAPAGLRERLESELDASPTRDEALSLVDKLERLATEYDERRAQSLDAYAAESANAASTADDLITILAPLDRDRHARMLEIVRIRQRMLETLSAAEWDSVFG